MVEPSADLALRFGPEFVSRANSDDAVTISHATPLAATDKATFIATNLIATAQWAVSRNVFVFAEALHELPGPAIVLAQGKAVDAGVLQVSFKV